MDDLVVEPVMLKRNLTLLAILLLCIVGFYFLNRVAYICYFDGDDYLPLRRVVMQPAAEAVKTLAWPLVDESNPRPMARLFSLALWHVVGMNYRGWIAAQHVLHFLTLIGVGLILLRLQVPLKGVIAGALFFFFHPAVLPLYWRPVWNAYALATLFAVAAMLAYMRGWRILSFVLFLAAIRSHEAAMALPFVLLWFEEKFGDGRWNRLIPFFAAGFWFGIVTLIAADWRDASYGASFGPMSVGRMLLGYGANLLLVPVAGLALLVAPRLVRDKAVSFGAFAFVALLVPMLIMPGRFNPALLYLPLVGATIAIAALAGRVKPVWIALAFLLWLPWCYHHLRPYRSQQFQNANDSRAYLGALEAYAQTHGAAPAFLYEAQPAHFHSRSARHAAELVYRRAPLRVEEAHGQPQPAAILGWDLLTRRLHVVEPQSAGRWPSFTTLDGSAVIWALGKGWYSPEPGFRWTAGEAEATLERPAAATVFEITLNVGEGQLKSRGGAGVEVLLDGASIGTAEFQEAGPRTARLALPKTDAGVVHVRLATPAKYRMPRVGGLESGAAVMRFGFR